MELKAIHIPIAGAPMFKAMTPSRVWPVSVSEAVDHGVVLKLAQNTAIALIKSDQPTAIALALPAGQLKGLSLNLGFYAVVQESFLLTGSSLIEPLMSHSPKKRSRRAATLADVGRAAGVSAMAVSAVLNGTKTSARISDETRERIETAALKSRYRPNVAARALVNNQMNTIGMSGPSSLPTRAR